MVSYNWFFKMICSFGFFALLVGCTGPGGQVSAPTHTSMPPTRDPTPLDPSLEPIGITWDGTECIVTGPSEVPVGRYPFLWNNLSDDTTFGFWVSLILNGNTFQDLLDLQPEPGVYYSKPDYVIYTTTYYSLIEEVWVVVLEEPGEYAIYVGGYNPMSLWFCEPLQVIETPSN